MLYEAVEALGREDEVVEEGYAEGVGRRLEPGGDISVLGARDEAARGVVVRDDDRAGPVGDRVGVDLARVDDR